MTRTVYADTNALIRFYIEQPGSASAQNLLAQHRMGGLLLPVTWLLEFELTNGIEQAVYTSRTSGQMRVTPESAAAAQAYVSADLESGTWISREDLSVLSLRERFIQLALRHTAKHGFRTYDLLHVASAQLLQCGAFWSFDGKARQLATLEGLTINPI